MLKQKYLNLIFLMLFTLLAAGCARGQPQLSLELTSFDFGTVENGDIVQRDIKLENRGSAPLIVQEISTSCSCTTAAVSPMTIRPNEEGVLQIKFDSGAHGPELEGKLQRQIFINTNDPQTKEAVVEFTADVIIPEAPE